MLPELSVCGSILPFSVPPFWPRREGSNDLVYMRSRYGDSKQAYSSRGTRTLEQYHDTPPEHRHSTQIRGGEGKHNLHQVNPVGSESSCVLIRAAEPEK
jgi:hypothetical protein